ncbi:MAG: transglutaminase protein, partial [Bryobacterales bacterium]|nr:transglutaminase protein [Bryobacterales bacterium]
LVAGVLLVTALVLASKVSFLFPDKEQHHVIPPRRPPASPPGPDVPLYSVKGTLTGPLRAGVIDVYDNKERAWLLPPVDNQRLQRLALPADVPAAPAAFGTATSVTVTVEQAKGHALPSVAGVRRVEGSATVDLDPRTQGFSLPQRPVFTGLRYTLTSNPAPTGKQLSDVTGVVPPALKDFLTAPAVPPAVQALLDKAPEGKYARLQALRTALYRSFIASGQGKPTDVSADRVVELLGGGTGNPYELTASEALLARWAGIPSRIGFGYYNGQPRDDGSVEFRPANAATYLEVYFAPYGWVPVIGTPPRAQQSLSNNQRNNDPNITASPELGISIYLPVRQASRLPLYEYARYFLVRTLPFLAGAGLLLLLYPLVLKRVRRRRRRAWAQLHGPAGAVAAAYCGLRDHMIDLALPGRGLTPLELVELVDEDEEHAELAWLASRGLWGDLRGRLTEADGDEATRLAASVAERLSKAQPETARLLAAVSRASLRMPYSTELPNAWWQPRLPRPRLRLRLARLRPATSAVLVLAVLLVGGCSSGGAKKAEPQVPFPTRLAPTAVAGLQVHEEDKAAAAYVKGAADKNVILSEGKVVSFNKNGLVQAALQVAQLKKGYISSDKDVVSAITRSIGDTIRRLGPQGGHELFALDDGSQRIYVWFPTVKSMALLVVRAQINAGAAEALARALIGYGDGGDIDDTALSAAFTASESTTPGTPSTAPSVEPTP